MSSAFPNDSMPKFTRPASSYRPISLKPIETYQSRVFAMSGTLIIGTPFLMEPASWAMRSRRSDISTRFGCYYNSAKEIHIAVLSQKFEVAHKIEFLWTHL